MILNITGKTNKDYVMINTAKLTLPDENVLTIDRDNTEYSIEDGKNLYELGLLLSLGCK